MSWIVDPLPPFTHPGDREVVELDGTLKLRAILSDGTALDLRIVRDALEVHALGGPRLVIEPYVASIIRIKGSSS